MLKQIPCARAWVGAHARKSKNFKLYIRPIFKFFPDQIFRVCHFDFGTPLMVRRGSKGDHLAGSPVFSKVVSRSAKIRNAGKPQVTTCPPIYSFLFLISFSSQALRSSWHP